MYYFTTTNNNIVDKINYSNTLANQACVLSYNTAGPRSTVGIAVRCSSNNIYMHINLFSNNCFYGSIISIGIASYDYRQICMLHG